MLAVEERRRHRGDEELRAVAVGAGILVSGSEVRVGRRGEAGTYGHGEEPGFSVLQREVLIGEGLGAVDAGRAGAVAVEEVAALAHEVANLGKPRQSHRWANGWVI